MPAKDKNQNEISVSGASLEAWLPGILPTLKTAWADYQFAANRPNPNFSDWLGVIHVAATAPQNLPKHLFKLLQPPKDKALSDWSILTDMLDLTFTAAKLQADTLTNTDWQSLIEIQNRILKAAAQISAKRQSLPSTNVLNKRALYLQTIAELDKKILSINDPTELLDQIVALVQQQFGYEYVNVFILSATKQTLTLQSAIWKGSRPEAENLITLQLEKGIVGRVAATGKSIMANDVSKQTGFFAHPALPNIKAQLATPLKTNADLIGVLDIESDQLNAFSADDRLIVQALADHLAVVIQNARLQKIQQRYLAEQSIIYDSIITLGTQLDINMVLKSMSQKITEAVSAGGCTICRIDEEAETITAISEYIVRHPGNPPGTWRPLNRPISVANDPICQQVLKAKRPIISRAKPNDSTKNLVWQIPANNPKHKSRWKVVLVLPFEIKKRVIGLIEIYDKKPTRTFSPEDVQLCRILATQTALAVEQTRLYEETVQRLNDVSMLYTMAQKISSSLNLEDVLNTIVISLREAIGCRACCIFLLDEEEQLEIKAAVGLKPQWRQMAKLELGEGAAGLAAAEARTIYLPDTGQEPEFIFFDKGVKSLMVVPLIAQGRVIGTINVDDAQTNAFGPAQERLLTIAAAQAGVTIENARLFARIAAEQQQMQAIIQHMADGVLLINKQGTIITCNSTVAIMLGMSRDEIVGQNIHENSLHPNLAKVTSGATYRARTGVLAKEITIEDPRPRTLQIFTTTVTDDERGPVGEVRVVHDVTKEKELEQLKDDFISTVSHELRTPLFSIQGFAQLMLEEGNTLDPNTQHEFLHTIQRQATQLSEMVNNLLDLSKFDEGKMVLERKPVSLLDLINQTILKLQGFAHQQQVKLVPKLPAALPPITGDKHRLEQVLTNLVGNAIKFSEPSQQVIISTTVSDTTISVQVKDHGIGIPPDALEKIFSRYYQVHDKHERSAMGSGLGLHIAKKIVEGHGGRIWAESETGQGSTFCFSLPISRQ